MITGTSGGATHRPGRTRDDAATRLHRRRSPASATTSPGTAVTYAVTVGAAGGFTGTVSLAASGLTASQGSVSFAPATLAGGSGASTMTVTTAGALAPGTYPLTITATSGTLSHSTQVNLVVARDFSVAVSPASLSLARGRSGSYTVSTSPIGGFTGNVSLSVTGIPSGATFSWSRNPVATPGSSTLTVRTSGSTSRGTFTIKVTGKSGSLTHTVTATLVVS